MIGGWNIFPPVMSQRDDNACPEGGCRLTQVILRLADA
jgi:hypothetical protein